MHLRAFTAVDAEGIVAVYRDAVRQIGPQAYNPEQVSAWARHPADIDEFRARLLRGHTLVAEEDGRIIAFGQLEPANHLAFIYTEGGHNRQGVGSAIYDALEHIALEQQVSEISTEASRISRCFFSKKGYRVVATEIVVHFGVEFERFRMSKQLMVASQPESQHQLTHPHA